MVETWLASVGRHKIYFVGIVICIIIFPVFTSWSHPHVFLHSSVKVIFDQKGLAGVRFKWVFDEMFSSMIIFDFDKNGNGNFEPEEITELKKGAFANLREFGYFTHIKIDGKPFKVKFVTDFSAAINRGKLVYQFLVPCHVQALESFKEVNLSIYDVTFYSSVFLAENPVVFENRQLYEVQYRIEKNRNNAYYYGQIYPEEIVLRFRRKND